MDLCDSGGQYGERIESSGGALVKDWFGELPGWAAELLDTSRVAHLGLLDEDAEPRVLPITFALHGGAVWSAIDDKPKRRDRPPARVRFLRQRPAVALTVDRYSDDWTRLAWLQLLGRADTVEAREQPAALAALASRYPQYRQATPGGPLIRIAVERTLSWRAD